MIAKTLSGSKTLECGEGSQRLAVTQSRIEKDRFHLPSQQVPATPVTHTIRGPRACLGQRPDTSSEMLSSPMELPPPGAVCADLRLHVRVETCTRGGGRASSISQPIPARGVGRGPRC